MAASSEAVATAAVIAVVAACIGFLGLMILRSWGKTARLYDSKVRAARQGAAARTTR